ncbi:MAG: DAK2 domain-containing protein [Clostridiales bacterium]|nr:DAK2 domain-containing protein [Clostridiales bacterium]
MKIVSVSGSQLKDMMLAAAASLNEHKSEIDAMNVFPVPDGDTGTNMSLTFLAAAREAEKAPDDDIGAVAKAVSGGSLRGARGNSGVILSQLFRGFAKGLEGLKTADSDDLTIAFRKAQETAYKAVMKPKEGTILTVARAMADRAAEVSYDTDDALFILKEAVKGGAAMLKRTPDMLPALKAAGVVDSGGYGLIALWTAAIRRLEGLDDDASAPLPAAAPKREIDFSALAHGGEITFGYCTEFFVHSEKPGEDMPQEAVAAFGEYLGSVGDSIVSVSDGDVLKVHVHTNHPGEVLEKALALGYLENLKIENMRVQHNEKIEWMEKAAEQPASEPETPEAPSGPAKAVGFVTVCAGDGFREIFEGLGADAVIEGGQTMNPSAADFLAAIESVSAEHIIIMPNNKNILLAAKQAAELAEGADVFVLPTASVPEGVSAMARYMPTDDFESVKGFMEGIIREVRTGQITYAVRDTTINGRKIKEGDALCIEGGEIKFVVRSSEDAARLMVNSMLERGGEVMSIYYGANISPETAEEVRAYAEGAHPGFEIDLYYGGQPVYDYYFAVE